MNEKVLRCSNLAIRYHALLATFLSYHNPPTGHVVVVAGG